MKRGWGPYLIPLHIHSKPRGPRLSKEGLDLRPGESSNSRPQEPPQSSPTQAPATGSPQHHSLGSIIRRPLFHYCPIAGNSYCSGKDLHNENFYDIPAFAALFKLRDSMRLVQHYSLEPFMTLHRFFYPHVVIEFYHTMTSRHDRNPTALHFSIDGREGILWAADIVATFNLPVVLANSAKYRQWSHPSP